ncbi:hypothetical protein JN11_00832 [Mucilaginibacter frigoritolerans]|uniref:Uncharacterized protein n=1 Tax=Mucilaginibacter frigoritolerans TaxID=652788 RepID=A0A562UBX1_9SPHI|nr:hypothetical protein [Mucilaginibacter frigoritolerans]TWJ03294.1 hypothetical protein JN11_00832 [Mucilaginibacter frigoritolerans]
MQDHDYVGKTQDVLSTLKTEIKKILEDSIEHLDENAKANQIRDFVIACAADVRNHQLKDVKNNQPDQNGNYSLKESVDAFKDEEAFPYLLDRIKDKPEVKDQIVQLATDCRQAIIDIVNDRI